MKICIRIKKAKVDIAFKMTYADANTVFFRLPSARKLILVGDGKS